jgi:hypothetical protein
MFNFRPEPSIKEAPTADSSWLSARTKLRIASIRAAALIALVLGGSFVGTGSASAIQSATCSEVGVIKVGLYPGRNNFRCFKGSVGIYGLGTTVNEVRGGYYYGAIYLGPDCRARFFTPNSFQGFSAQYACAVEITPPF